jgi:hypothetical protein
VRYEARDLIDAGYCHCRLCQRSSGAPVVAWASLPTTSLSYTSGKPTTYHSSANGRREFCAACGTQIAFRDVTTPARSDVNIATLDDPDSVKPQYHTWVSSQISWFEIADDLPRHADHGPDGPDAPTS